MTVLVITFIGVSLASLTCLYIAPKLLKGERQAIRHRIAHEFVVPKEKSDLIRPTSALALSPKDEYELLLNERDDVKTGTKTATSRIQELLEKADFRITVKQFIIASVGMAIATGILGWLATESTVGIIFSTVGLLAPMLMARIRKNVRQQRLQQQLPNAFELMARVIRAGQSVPQALEAISEGFDEPLRSEFNNCLQQQSLGLSADVVFQEMAKRNEIVELRLFALGMAVQRQMGGNLTELLERLASLVRARMKLQQQVRTLTAEGRLQGITLSVIPVVLFAAMYFVNRPYAMTLLKHPDLLAVTGGMMIIGLLWIRYITKIG